MNHIDKEEVHEEIQICRTSNLIKIMIILDLIIELRLNFIK